MINYLKNESRYYEVARKAVVWDRWYALFQADPDKAYDIGLDGIRQTIPDEALDQEAEVLVRIYRDDVERYVTDYNKTTYSTTRSMSVKSLSAKELENERLVRCCICFLQCVPSKTVSLTVLLDELNGVKTVSIQRNKLRTVLSKWVKKGLFVSDKHDKDIWYSLSPLAQSVLEEQMDTKTTSFISTYLQMGFSSSRIMDAGYKARISMLCESAQHVIKRFR
jgi:hypothetical protein